MSALGTELAIEIGPAAPAELPLLQEIERRAAQLFSAEDLPPAIAGETIALETYVEAQREGHLMVARLASGDERGRIVGLALLSFFDGHAHLEELDVEPEFGRRGIGRRLVEAALRFARESGHDRITLSTFSEVPWNGPFYAGMGFEPMSEIELGPGLRQRRENEHREGFDLDRRCMMSRALGDRDGCRR